MTWWEALLLGLVQGLTEFIPVSSSGHLVLGQYLLGLGAEQADVTFEVFVHFGTVLSILTVYGNEVGVGEGEGDFQHRGYGKRLVRRAEEIATDAGYEKLAVISGIGAREYYREQLDYRRDGPYMSKRL